MPRTTPEINEELDNYNGTPIHTATRLCIYIHVLFSIILIKITINLYFNKKLIG